MRNLIMIAVVISFILLAGCTNQAQMDEMLEEIKEYETKISDLEVKVDDYKLQVTDLESELETYKSIDVEGMDLGELKSKLEILQNENIALKEASDSLKDVIEGLRNPSSINGGSTSHPTIPIEPIK